MPNMFGGIEAQLQESSIDQVVEDQKALAAAHLSKMLENGPQQFPSVVDALLQAFMLRETNVKDICVDMAKRGQIQNTWGSGNKKPSDPTIICV